MFALEPEDLERFAIPIGLAIAALLVLAVPSLRRALAECFPRWPAARAAALRQEGLRG